MIAPCMQRRGNLPTPQSILLYCFVPRAAFVVSQQEVIWRLSSVL